MKTIHNRKAKSILSRFDPNEKKRAIQELMTLRKENNNEVVKLEQRINQANRYLLDLAKLSWEYNGMSLDIDKNKSARLIKYTQQPIKPPQF